MTPTVVLENGAKSPLLLSRRLSHANIGPVHHLQGLARQEEDGFEEWSSSPL
jgi:hypothetical protein